MIFMQGSELNGIVASCDRSHARSDAVSPSDYAAVRCATRSASASGDRH